MCLAVAEDELNLLKKRIEILKKGHTKIIAAG